jgi:hypothetical protein
MVAAPFGIRDWDNTSKLDKVVMGGVAKDC